MVCIFPPTLTHHMYECQGPSAALVSTCRATKGIAKVLDWQQKHQRLPCVLRPLAFRNQPRLCQAGPGQQALGRDQKLGQSMLHKETSRCLRTFCLLSIDSCTQSMAAFELKTVISVGILPSSPSFGLTGLTSKGLHPVLPDLPSYPRASQ